MGKDPKNAQVDDELSADDLESVSGGVSTPTSTDLDGVKAGVRVKVKFPVVGEE